MWSTSVGSGGSREVAYTGVMEEIRRWRRHEEARDKRKSKARTLGVLPEVSPA